MVSAQAFSQLLAILHSTPLQAHGWERFLEQLCVETESMHGFFICSSSANGLAVTGHGGSADMLEGLRVYNETEGNIDPYRAPFMASARMELLDGDELLPERELLQTPMYKRVLEPSGLRYSTLMTLSVTPRRLEVLSIWRGWEQGPMEEDKREFLRMLMPHVRIALDVRHRLEGAERQSCDLIRMLDKTPTAALLVSGDGFVTHLNEAARTLCSARLGLELRKGRLCSSDRMADARLQQLVQPVRRAGQQPVLATGGALSIERHGRPGRALQLLATPLAGTADGIEAGSMMVLITDPESEVCFPDHVLRAMYGLTPAETEVANAYLTGYSSEEIAMVRGVTLSTVRSQLKVLLQKTHTRRQSDLMRLLMTLPRLRGEAHGVEIR